MVTLPWHGLVGLGFVFSATPIVMVIPLGIGFVELSILFSSSPDVVVIPP
jgi:hypothetical protein